jgi:hypothetical protein
VYKIKLAFNVMSTVPNQIEPTSVGGSPIESFEWADLEVKTTESKNDGLFAKKTLEKGTVIPMYGIFFVDADSKNETHTEYSLKMETTTKIKTRFKKLFGNDLKPNYISIPSQNVNPHNKVPMNGLAAWAKINEAHVTAGINCLFVAAQLVVCKQIDAGKELLTYYGSEYDRKDYKTGIDTELTTYNSKLAYAKKQKMTGTRLEEYADKQIEYWFTYDSDDLDQPHTAGDLTFNRLPNIFMTANKNPTSAFKGLPAKSKKIIHESQSKWGVSDDGDVSSEQMLPDDPVNDEKDEDVDGARYQDNYGKREKKDDLPSPVSSSDDDDTGNQGVRTGWGIGGESDSVGESDNDDDKSDTSQASQKTVPYDRRPDDGGSAVNASPERMDMSDDGDDEIGYRDDTCLYDKLHQGWMDAPESYATNNSEVVKNLPRLEEKDLTPDMKREHDALIDHIMATVYNRGRHSSIAGAPFKGLMSWRCRAFKKKGKGARCNQYTRERFPFCDVHSRYSGMRITKMANETIKEGVDTAEKIMYCRVEATQEYQKGQLVALLDSVYNIVLDFDRDTTDPPINLTNFNAFAVGAQFDPPKRRVSEKYKQYWSDMCYNNQANKTQLFLNTHDDADNHVLIDSSAPNTSHPSRYILIPPYINSNKKSSNINFQLCVIDTHVLYGTKNVVLPRPVLALRANRKIKVGEVLYCHIEKGEVFHPPQ